MLRAYSSPLFILIALMSIGCGASTKVSSSAQKSEASSESNPRAETPLRLNSLETIKTFDDLKHVGLVAPTDHNHKAGTQLVLLALRGTAVGKGDWMMAHALLGVSMLDIGVIEHVAYRSLSLRYAVGGSKLEAVRDVNNNNLLIDSATRLPKSSPSAVARREAALYCIAYHLEARYIYDDSGNYMREYRPAPYPKTNNHLGGCVASGMGILRDLKAKGFEDSTLRDALGIAFASLQRDGALRSLADAYELGAFQVFTDALNAALARLAQSTQHSDRVLDVIALQMQIRGLVIDDVMLLPVSQAALDALLEIVKGDLVSIDRKTN